MYYAKAVKGRFLLEKHFYRAYMRIYPCTRVSIYRQNHYHANRPVAIASSSEEAPFPSGGSRGVPNPLLKAPLGS